jgi:molybdopterin/thiamine biosynthesis adenylyltransferase
MRVSEHERAYRSPETLDRVATTGVVVAGVGALGGHLVVGLVRQGFRQVRVVDQDRVSPDNLGTQVYGFPEVGRLKAVALRDLVFRDTEVEVEPVARPITATTADRLLFSGSFSPGKGMRVVVDALDNHDAREAVRGACRHRGVLLLHLGVSGDGYGEVVWDHEGYTVPPDPEGVDPCGVPLARNLLVLVATVGAEVLVHYLGHGEMFSRVVTLGDVQVRPRV